MGEKLTTTVTTTAAESPWTNGVNEQHNALLGEMISKTMEDCNCSLETALAWSVCAKNSLANVYGYSPQQLVFGKNAAFPSVLHDKLPALDENCHSKLMRDNLNALHSARRNFVRAESSEKLQRALRMKTRTHTGMVFSNGQAVYYKRENCNTWKGPGRVIGVDGQTVIVKHGGQIIRVHSSMLKLENAEFTENNKHFQGTNNDKQLQSNCQGNIQDNSKTGDNAEHDAEMIETGVIDTDTVVDNAEVINPASSDVDISNQRETQAGSSTHEEIAGGHAEESTVPGKLPMMKSSVLAKPVGSSEWRPLKIISRGGKATGKYARWLNVRDEDTQQTECINWDEIAEWKEALTEEVLISENFNDDEILASKFTEIDKWKEYGVFEEVVNNGQKAISTRWVCTEKDGKIKSRLVARGYEDEECSERVDSPTCSKSNLRLIIAISASQNWRINSLDVQSAFLQGESVSGDIFLKPPKEVNTNKLWKLFKHVYGLKQSSRKWYNQISLELGKLGIKKSKMDEAVFYWYSDGELKGLMAGHVDDFFWCGSDEFKERIINKLKLAFKISSDLHDSFNFLGLYIHQTSLGIEVNQSSDTEGIQYIEFAPEQDKQRKLSDDEKAPLRSTIGQLCWLANQTRPDIAYEVCQLSVSFKDAKVSDVITANKVIKKLKCNNLCLKFPKLSKTDLLILKVYSDSSFNNLPNGGSQGGYVIFLCDTESNAAPIQWQSRRIRRVVKSTLAAECLALEDAVDTAYYLKCVLMEILHLPPDKIFIECFIDNKSLYDSLHSSTNVREEKRLILDIALIKEMLLKKEINSINLVESKRQLADSLTKQGASSECLTRILSSGDMKLS